ncbi:hypothetical protein [Arthrobacter sp. MA-N2]|uniref:hypothetical protein n=1 Tax=Arthrobacter sp. MA-N2 TaxID=1101188 RepID=UPI001E587A10|nr:hypothetical protein [Arthrobacter sp. MA-N2]
MTAAEALGLAAAVVTGEVCRDAGALAAGVLACIGPAWEHSVGAAERASAVSVGCVREADAADASVWPADPDFSGGFPAAVAALARPV